MAKSSININVDALIRLASFTRDLSEKQISQVKIRAISTLKRRLGAEASRQISEKILNLPPRVISGYLDVKADEQSITLTGSDQRPPISAFKPTWGGRTSPGVVATIWRDQGAVVLPHTFLRPGSKEVWQRIPTSRSKTQQVGQGRDSSRQVIQSAGALVGRLPIVVRKGPAMARAVYERKHGDIYPQLVEFGRNILSDEVSRLVDLLKNR